MPISTEKPVLVTGGTGYLAGGIIKDLLDAGVTVHTTVRDLGKKEKYEALVKAGKESPGTIKFFQADLVKPGSFAEAIEGCSIVFHTASPFPEKIRDSQKELIDPAVGGTRNVLNQVTKSGSVKRVVLTSSSLALHTDAKDVTTSTTGVLNEECWNETASLSYQPYAYSKVMAEKAAWEFAEGQDVWDLVVINPGLIMGPCRIGMQLSAQSVGIMKAFGDGSFSNGAPRLAMCVGDIREISKAHIEAAFRPEAKGRYLVCKHETDFFEMTQIVAKKYGADYMLPKSAVPKAILWAFGPYIDERMNRKFVSRNVGLKFKTDTSKSERELGIQYRPLETTLNEMFQQLVDNGVLQKKNGS